MKQNANVCALCWILTLWIGSGAYAELRTWKSSDGRTLQAELISFDPAKSAVEIRVATGQTYVLPLERLSEVDQAWVAETHRKQEEEKQKIMEEIKSRAGNQKKYTVVGTHTTTYSAYFPKNYNPDSPPPLIIMFSPGGNGASVIQNLKQGCDELGWVAVGVDTLRNNADEKEFDARFKEVLPHVLGEIKPNLGALYMGGMSGGAMRAYDYSAKFDQKWRGILAFGGWMGGEEAPKNTAKNMRVAMVNGDADKAANAWVDPDEKMLKKRSSKVKVIRFPGGHVIPPPSVVTEAMQWLHSD